MALKGTTRIELTNVKTGEREVIEKDNLVTNAVNDILTLNPFGAWFRSYQTQFIPHNNTSGISSYIFEKQFLPLCPNLFGGILLYEKTLEEAPDKYFADMDNLLVGYSSNTVNTGEDVRRGSMNQTESGPLDDGTGYRFVFDFATSQANGTISSLGLTSKMGGVAGYGSEYDNYNNFVFLIDGVSNKSISQGTYSTEANIQRNVVSIDLEKGEAIYAYVSDLNMITLGKLKFPTYSIGLLDVYNSYLDSVLYSETTVITETFASVLDENYGAFYGTLIDGGDGYIWGFQHEGNAKGNSTGSATILWVKISKEDWSFEEGSFVVDAQLEFFGAYHTGYNNKTFSENKNNLIIKDGTLYAIKYATKANYMSGVYLIPLANPTNVTLMEFEGGGEVIYNSAEYSNNYYYYNSTNVNEINGIIRYRGAYINGGVLHKTSYMQSTSYGLMCLLQCAKPGLRFGPYIFSIGLRRYSSIPDVVVFTYIQSCYLATINNLATPVEKTADKTMKITYILREE